MNVKSNSIRALCLTALMTLTSGTALADPCTSEDYYWCDYYYQQCLINGGGGACDSQYLACLVSIGCSPP
jgi:hypothetical protein